MKKLLILSIFTILSVSLYGQAISSSVASYAQPSAGSFPEKITNGVFADGTSWNASAGVTIAAGVCSFDGTAFQSLTQTDADMVTSFAINTDYTMTFDITNDTGVGISCSIRNGDASVTYIASADYSDGSYSLDFTTPGAIGVAGLRIRVGASSGTGDMDNVSIKQR